MTQQPKITVDLSKDKDWLAILEKVVGSEPKSVREEPKVPKGRLISKKQKRGIHGK
jgi:hypothetical protein